MQTGGGARYERATVAWRQPISEASDAMRLLRWLVVVGALLASSACEDDPTDLVKMDAGSGGGGAGGAGGAAGGSAGSGSGGAGAGG